MRLSAEDLMHHPWFADMKTRMKIRPYKPKQTASFRLRKLEEGGERAVADGVQRSRDACEHGGDAAWERGVGLM